MRVASFIVYFMGSVIWLTLADTPHCNRTTNRAVFLSVVSLAAALAGMSVINAACAQGKTDVDLAAQKVAASICASCHGPAGVSASPLFPDLAGQKETYLLAQLKAFKAVDADRKLTHWGCG